MPVLRVDDDSIAYEVKHHARSRRLRITVRPGRVLVTAPPRARLKTITEFVESQRYWIRDKVTALADHPVAIPERFVTGAKILYRGRALRLRVERTSGSRSSLRFANGFRVTLPRELAPEEVERRARSLVLNWLAERTLEDARRWTRENADRLGVQPARIRLGNQRSLWGSCSPRGVIALNRRLISIPKSLFEYVVIHELCHLVEHNHGARFWELVESLLPDYRDRRAQLKRYGGTLA